MTQRSLFWDGAVLGDCGPYTQLHLQDQFFRSLLNGTGNRGPLRGWRDELLVSGTVSPLTVAAGGAVVYGMLYDCNAATTVNIPKPTAGNNRYDRIVVQRAWATQVVRVARVSGVAAAAPVVPALAQTAGSFWEIPLATVYVTDAGVITVTDTREFCTFSTDWPANAVNTEHYAAGAVTTGKVPNRARYEIKGSGQIEADDTNPCTWTAGGSYDYWSFADAATNAAWVYFMAPTSLVGTVSIYVWSVPNVNGAGGGAENCQWDYNSYSGPYGGTLTAGNGTINADQQARVNTAVYRDQLIAALAITAGHILILQLSRAGVADSYNNAMRLLGIELAWTADA